MSDFRPKSATVEKGQIPDVVNEFRQFLEDRLNEDKIDKDTLLILQIE